MPETTESPVELVRAIVAAHRGERGVLLPILHDIQNRFGYIDPDLVPALAHELNMSRADVHGVITFYTDFRSEPGGAATVRICRAEACQSVGAEKLVADAEQVFGVKAGQTTPDGSVTLQQVFCLGNCALGPAAQVNGRMYGRVDRGRLIELLANEGDA
ncbi:MAG: NADH-quinone oxidoreductase subunit E [Actinophytocola sp.]|nr:NADH-quinone oxidoreductase subunit E [Actinophytocola sp.]